MLGLFEPANNVINFALWKHRLPHYHAVCRVRPLHRQHVVIAARQPPLMVVQPRDRDHASGCIGATSSFTPQAASAEWLIVNLLTETGDDEHSLLVAWSRFRMAIRI